MSPAEDPIRRFDRKVGFGILVALAIGTIAWAHKWSEAYAEKTFDNPDGKISISAEEQIRNDVATAKAIREFAKTEK